MLTDVDVTPVEKKGRTSYNLKDYTPEFWGKRKSYLSRGKVMSVSNHGFVVNSLMKELESNYFPKGNFVKNVLIDLGVVLQKKPYAIFEIKTSTNPYSIYTAIGQLLLHAHNVNSKAKRFVVLPNSIENEIIKDLDALGIQTVTYDLKGNKIAFHNLHAFFN